jgi:adenylate cyclase
MDAMSAAVAIQNELKTRNKDVPDERKVRFRIGVNSGDVIEGRGGIYGVGVNVAARLESLADPGGICISDAVRTAGENILRIEPEYSLRTFAESQPFRDADVLDRHVEGLRKAGLPG